MSAIYGYVDLEKNSADKRLLDSMSEGFPIGCFDGHTQLVRHNVAFGFLNQVITDQAEYEALPIYDEQRRLYFTADAIIDNRDDLIRQLNLSPSGRLTDSQLIFEAYKKWGSSCAEHLLGDFAFVVYHENENRVCLCRDHVGARLLYYRVEGKRIYFSSLLGPLAALISSSPEEKISEQYLVEFLAIGEIRHSFTPKLTIYKDVYYVLPASCLTFDSGKSTEKIYWDPSKIKTSHKYNDKNYLDEFRSIFSDAVKCRLRSKDGVGVLLSGGLDSSSVACVAAGLLAAENKNLNTYTSIPLKGLKTWGPENCIPDETEFILLMKKAYDNMTLHFVDSPGDDSIKAVGATLRAFEQPYKFIENSFWLNNILRQSRQDGCSVLLNGFFGNFTISFGSIFNYLFEHLIRFRLLSLVSDSFSFCRLNKISRKQFSSYFFKKSFATLFVPEKRRLVSKLLEEEYAKKYDVDRSLLRAGYTGKPFRSFRQEQKLALQASVLNHIAESTAKTSLQHHIAMRDPTSDKRLIEYCLRLPYKYYYYKDKGLARGLVRRAMENTVPQAILDIHLSRGKQSADWIARIEPVWNEVLSCVEKAADSGTGIFKYTNSEFLHALIERNRQIEYTEQIGIEMRNIIMLYIMVHFERL